MTDPVIKKINIRDKSDHRLYLRHSVGEIFLGLLLESYLYNPFLPKDNLTDKFDVNAARNLCKKLSKFLKQDKKK